MQAHLMGWYENTIDAKGRIVVPAEHRTLLGTNVVLTLSDTKSLRLYSEEEYDKLYNKIVEAKSAGVEGVRYLVNLFVNPARQIQIDGQGRIVIPPEMRKAVGLVHDVTIAGSIDRIEIWDTSEYELAHQVTDEEQLHGAMNYVGAI